MNKAKLIGFDEFIEEEVELEINKIKFVGFASVCPYEIKLNEIYPVKIHVTIFEEEVYRELQEVKYGLQCLNNTYSYIISGKVYEDGNLDIGDGITVQTEVLFKKALYLHGKFIELNVDRLDIEFL